jgi:hypothetical protein
MHPRAELRNTVQELLIAASTLAGERVFKSRTRPVADDAIPCILIFTTDEEVTSRTDDESYQARTREVLLHLQLWTSFGASETDADGILDDFCLAVEAVMDANQHLSLSESLTRTSHQYESTKTRLHDAEKRLLWALLTYRAGYLG